ncbi:unnamed protein product, partial [Pocillopora meandrina]
MSSKRVKQKETVEEDFEAFVRHQLSSISDDLKEMKGTQVIIQRNIESLQNSTGKDCIAKLRDIIENDLQLQSNIENAYRIGPFKNDGTPRPILAKVLYCPEWFKVIEKKRDLRDGVPVLDDLIWEDRQKKKQMRSVMKKAFEAGKR